MSAAEDPVSDKEVHAYVALAAALELTPDAADIGSRAQREQMLQLGCAAAKS